MTKPKNPLPTPKELEILKVLLANGAVPKTGGDFVRSVTQAMYGLEIVRASQGRIRQGSVYVLLNLLVKRGLVSSEPTDNLYHSGMPRRKYRMTDKGLVAWELWEKLK